MRYVLLALAVLTAITVCLFGYDKWQARRGGRRVPESTLLLASFLCGGVGGWLAIALWRHKSRKRSFQVKLALVTALDAAAAWAAWRLFGGA